MYRSIASTSTIRAAVASRSLHTTPVTAKSVTEKVSEVADAVNKKVGKGFASAIETGEKATEKTKETVVPKAEAAKQKANQATADVRGAKEDVKKDLKD